MKTQFGTIVKQLRERKGMDQKQLGEIVGVSDKTVSSWEINRTEPKWESFSNLLITLAFLQII